MTLVFSRNSHMPLNNRRILVVEDEAMVALLVEDELIDLGAKVLGPAASVEDALALLTAAASDGGLDAAVLDMNLGGESVAPVADALLRIGVPFVLMTGYDEGLGAGPHEGVPRLQKPFVPCDLLDLLEGLLRPAARLGA